MTHSTAAAPSEGWTLVVLAAGLGRRYRGAKQLEPMGPAGETLADYTVWDALHSGATMAVFVTRPDLADALRAHHNRWEGALPIEHAVQHVHQLPAGFTPPPERTRPWGTVHAVLATRPRLEGPFAVGNADDFYGQEAIRRMAEFQAGTTPVAREFAVAGYRLRDTLSAHGGVSRALLETADDGRVRRIIELSNLTDSTRGITGRRNDEIVHLTGDELVSMNLWGLTPALFDPLAELFARFLREQGDSPTAECPLPDAMEALVRDGAISLRAFPVEGGWVGLTHPGDRDAARAAIRERVARGEYPADLFRAARG